MGANVTQYGAAALEQIGLLKMDFLGLINLTILSRAVENSSAARTRQWTSRISRSTTRKAFELLGRGDTTGIFQLESAGIAPLRTGAKTHLVQDLAAMVALYRPGPMATSQPSSAPNTA